MDPLLDGSSSAESSRYWDGVLGATLDARPIEPWRAYMQHVYVGLMRRWLTSSLPGPSLKTDLFEEAVTDHELLSKLGPGSVGLDCSPAIAAKAHDRLRGPAGDFASSLATCARSRCGEASLHAFWPGRRWTISPTSGTSR